MPLKKRRLLFTLISSILLVGLLLSNIAFSQVQSRTNTQINKDINKNAKNVESLRKETDLLWTCIAAFLVFFMQAGFAMVESGFTRSKNALNIIMKNLLDFAVGSIAFWVIGFSLMFGNNTSGWIGKPIFFMKGLLIENGKINNSHMAFFLFQLVFAATAATIVSGAMAERTRFRAYLGYSFFVTAIIYPIFGSWAWNSLSGIYENSSGWLEQLGFLDFAGSTVVHSVGGWIGLAGAVLLGARIGKYSDNKIRIFAGHNIPMAALGVFILWLGWFGFNPGSTMSVRGGSFAHIAVTTNMAAAAGTLGALITAWIIFKKADVGMTLNGSLAGLVAITAGCDSVSPLSSIIIGLAAGILVVFSIIILDKIRVDDPVGAISVHGTCGIWGTLAVGLFHMDKGLLYGNGFSQLGIQFLGIFSAFIVSFGLGLLLFYIIKKTLGLRVPREEELSGLDYIEHGNSAYADFEVTFKDFDKSIMIVLEAIVPLDIISKLQKNLNSDKFHRFSLQTFDNFASGTDEEKIDILVSINKENYKKIRVEILTRESYKSKIINQIINILDANNIFNTSLWIYPITEMYKIEK